MKVDEILEKIIPEITGLLKEKLLPLADKSEATFYELEEQTQEVIPLIGQIILQELIDGQKNGLIGPQKRCRCGGLQIYRDSYRNVYIQSSVGEILIKDRAYYRCEGCAETCFPIDEQLGLNSSGQMSRYLQEQVGWLYASLPAALVRTALERFHWPVLSTTQIRTKAQALGEEIDEHLTQEVRKTQNDQAWPVPCLPLRLVPEADTVRLYAAPDGWMYCSTTVDEQTGKMQWKEMKVAAVYEGTPQAAEETDLAQAHGVRERNILFARQNNPEQEIAPTDQARKITYVARTQSWEEFGPYLWAELKQRGLDRAVKELLGVADGAPRIDSVVEAQLRGGKHELTRILDISHAQQHLWKVANMVFGEGSAEAKSWSRSPLQALERGEKVRLNESLVALRGECVGREKVLEEINRAINYFTERAAQIDYLSFVIAGYQIGSGLAESACKRFGTDRMKGVGMRWTVGGAQATANLRMMLLSDRWSEVSHICRHRKVA